MILKDLFANFAILISILFLYSQMTKDSPLQVNSSVKYKVCIGFLGGILSFVLMAYSLKIDTTIIDLRHIPVVILAYYAGTIPAFTAMILVIIGRFIIGINLSAFSNIILISFITVFSVYLSKTKYSKRIKIISILTFSNLVFTILISILVRDLLTLVFLLPLFWSFSYVGGYIAFYMIEFMRKSQQLYDKYKFESITDGLTGLNNVRKFDDEFNHIINSVNVKQESLSLLYIDIDHFKNINDTYGHSEGDVILKELGSILKSCSRSFDIVSRNGGEEFTVLLLDCPLSRAKEIAENIRRMIEEFSFPLESGNSIHLTVSIGVASYLETTTKGTKLIEDEDKALYTAKRSGRNKVCIAE